MWWKKIQSMDSKFTHLSISKVNNIPIKPHEENPCFSWGKQNPCFSLQRVCEGDAGLTISLRAWCPWIVPSSNHDFMDELYSMKVCPHWLTKLHPFIHWTFTSDISCMFINGIWMTWLQKIKIANEPHFMDEIRL